MKLYLTDSECYFVVVDGSNNITESDVVGMNFIRLEFAGTPIVEDKTSIDYILYLYKNTLNVIKKTKDSNSTINLLFKYQGSLSIRKAVVFLDKSKPRQIKIIDKRFKYMSKKINTISEDMGLLSEEIKIKTPLRVNKAKLKNNAITNISPKKQLFNKDGTGHKGLIHQILEGPNALAYYSGGTPSKDSNLLYSRKRTTLLKRGAKTRNQRVHNLIVERMRNKK